jgi:prepilin-type N-terminal cleavage/methylation domain-containing protein
MVPGWVRRIVTSPGGFTMAELVVVVAILGLVAAISAPTLWTSLRSATLRAGAEEAVAVLNGARHLAIRMNTTVCVRNDGTRARYHVGSCAAAAWTGVGTDAGGNISLANGLRVGGSPTLCFNALGAGAATPSPCAANGTLLVTSPSGGDTLSVIMATSGRLRIQ